jgi:hypothetical protein
MRRAATGGSGDAEVGSTEWVVRIGNVSLSLVRERTSMKAYLKAYLKFAANFWMSAFLKMGSLATAQSTSTARAKKSSAANAAPVPQL